MNDKTDRESENCGQAPACTLKPIDGDFPTGKECKHHCSPSCHPAQIGPEWVYGCTHPAWPQNRHGDFVPIVDCGGDPSKCDLCKTKLIGQYIGGMKRRIANAEAKAEKFSVLLMEAVSLRWYFQRHG